MSEDPDFALIVGTDGKMDILVSPTGDFTLVPDPRTLAELTLEQLREKGWQTIIVALLTSQYTIPDPDDPTGDAKLAFGSNFEEVIGALENSELVRMLFQASIGVIVMGTGIVEEIQLIEFAIDRANNTANLQLGVKFVFDEEYLQRVISFG